MVRPLVLFALGVTALTVLCGPASAAPLALRSGPVMPRDVVTLERTAMDPAGRAWVTGRTDNTGGSFVSYYEGGAWHALPSPPAYSFGAVAPLALDDVWVSGYSRIVHWDGVRWKAASLPRVSRLQVLDLAATAPDDVWAVGVRSGRLVLLPGDGEGYWTRLDRAVVLHWNGSVWKVVRLPRLPGIDQRLEAVACGGGKVWAVGSTRSLTNPEDVGSRLAAPEFHASPLILRRSAGSWARVRHAQRGHGGTYLLDVSVASGGAPWITGLVRVTADGVGRERYFTLVEERTGPQWAVRMRSSLTWRALPRALAAVSGSDVWLAYSDNHGEPGVRHWDGHEWNTTPSGQLGWTPTGTMSGSSIQDITATSDSAWLLGGWTLLAGPNDTVGDPLVWRHDAAGWVKIPFSLKAL